VFSITSRQVQPSNIFIQTPDLSSHLRPCHVFDAFILAIEAPAAFSITPNLKLRQLFAITQQYAWLLVSGQAFSSRPHRDSDGLIPVMESPAMSPIVPNPMFLSTCLRSRNSVPVF
jgi:hypothetical protein